MYEIVREFESKSTNTCVNVKEFNEKHVKMRGEEKLFMVREGERRSFFNVFIDFSTSF